MSGMSSTANTDSDARSGAQHEGIVVRATSAAARPGTGSRCSCTPTFQAQVWSPREHKTIRKTFATLAEARAWRQESQVALRKGTLRAPSRPRSRKQPRSGSPRPRQGSSARAPASRTSPRRCAPTGRRSTTASSPRLGSKRLTAISHTMLQDLADQLSAQGLSRKQCPQHDPAAARDLPPRPPPRRRRPQPHPQARAPRRARPAATASPPRPRSAPSSTRSRPPTGRSTPPPSTPASASANSKPSHWDDIDLDTNLIHVERSWDRHAGFIAPKSRSGNRRVPITHTLRRELLNHRLHQGTRRPRLRLPEQTRQQAVQPRHPHTPHQAKPGRPPASHRSASTNAATATPPT